jgi:hypothetical protein
MQEHRASTSLDSNGRSIKTQKIKTTFDLYSNNKKDIELLDARNSTIATIHSKIQILQKE